MRKWLVLASGALITIAIIVMIADELEDRRIAERVRTELANASVMDVTLRLSEGQPYSRFHVADRNAIARIAEAIRFNDCQRGPSDVVYTLAPEWGVATQTGTSVSSATDEYLIHFPDGSHYWCDVDEGAFSSSQVEETLQQAVRGLEPIPLEP
jgi:hypothetical protein